MNPKILIIDDDKDICVLLERFLNRKGFECSAETDELVGFEMIRKHAYDLVITDLKLPSISGIELLQKIKLLSPQTKVIIITGYSDIKTAVEAMKYGASNYVSKPLYPEELLSIIKESLEVKELQEKKPKARKVETKVPDKTYLIGNSASSQKLFDDINLVAPTDMSVLITGETGTGKEYVAREIHKRSDRSDKTFMAVDCGALPKDIAASEFFGHEKGAFTGALKDKDGLFKLADSGTLFLDEIGNLPYDVQVQLLRVLQEGKYKKVGGNKIHTCDVRIIAATNEDLSKAIENSSFRQDLYFRVNEFKLHISPLRFRTEDIEDFSNFFLKMACQDLNKEVHTIDPEVLEIFSNYTWPGNLREMKNVIKRATLRSTAKVLDKSCLPQEITLGENKIQKEEQTDFSFLKAAASQAEKETILQVLKETGNNKTKAAKILNIDRKTLYNKLKAFDI